MRLTDDEHAFRFSRWLRRQRNDLMDKTDVFESLIGKNASACSDEELQFSRSQYCIRREIFQEILDRLMSDNPDEDPSAQAELEAIEKTDAWKNRPQFLRRCDCQACSRSTEYYPRKMLEEDKLLDKARDKLIDLTAAEERVIRKLREQGK